MLLSWALILSLLGAAAGWTVCYDPGDCYSSSYPFSGTPGRPFAIMPLPLPIQWFLYTKDNQYRPQEIFPSDPANFSSSRFDFTKKTYIIIHGYLQYGQEPWINTMCQELMKYEDVNCVSVDWSSGSYSLYIQAVNIVRAVGRQVARVLDMLKEVHNYPASNVHLIGHSLGAHIVGTAGKFHKNIDRITGLDPAGPYFEGQAEAVRLSRNDARFVDVIHTNGNSLSAYGLGLNQPIGDVDFYPNGGEIMPECPDVRSIEYQAICLLYTISGPTNCSESSLSYFDGCEELTKDVTLTEEEITDKIYLVFCSHFQSIRYYTNSIGNRKKYAAHPCHPLQNCLQGISEPCPEKGCQSMGYHARPPTSPEPQTYTLKTMVGVE